MGDKNFQRRYVLKAGRMERSGFMIGGTSQGDPHTLHISFSVEKSTSETLNTARVQIWNLSPANLKVLDTKDCVIELQAGYEDHIALIVVGNVTSVVTQPDGADRMTEIEVADGRAEIRDTYMTVSYKGKTNTKKVFEYISGEMGLSVVYSKGCTFKDLPKGFSFVGPARNALKKLCSTCGLTWSIQNKVLHIRMPNEAISTKGYLLNQETGLIGIPKRITLADETTGTESAGEKAAQIGYEVRYLLNGAIGVNDYVKLDSTLVAGYFRVQKLTIDGDSHEGEWCCTAQLLEVD